MPRHISWTRDEVILALDLYYGRGRNYRPDKADDVRRLARLLRDFPAHAEKDKPSDFRSLSAVNYKIRSFAALDETKDVQPISDAKITTLVRDVWAEWSGRWDELKSEADSIRMSAAEVEYDARDPMDDEKGEVYREKGTYYEHRRRERNRKLVEDKKEKVLAEIGKLECEVCGFDFVEMYGELGEGFAECHHRTPVAELEEDEEVTLEDLAIVCSNCHRMIHRSDPMIAVGELSQVIR